MLSNIEKIFTVIVIVVLAGCAGKDFVRPDSGALMNGQTTYNQIVQQFGKPYAEGSVLKNERFVKTVSYAYASVGGKSHRGGTAARAMGFYFVDDTLVGYEFNQSTHSQGQPDPGSGCRVRAGSPSAISAVARGGTGLVGRC